MGQRVYIFPRSFPEIGEIFQSVVEVFLAAVDRCSCDQVWFVFWFDLGEERDARFHGGFSRNRQSSDKLDGVVGGNVFKGFAA